MPQHEVSFTLTFPTESKFCGKSDRLGMQGYGLYVYPDSARYLGYFHNNRFHGQGCITLPWPHNMTFEVEHRHGKLTKIQHITFADDLIVEFDMNEKNTKISFDNWLYCTHKDRRFCGEIFTPMKPVGPEKYASWEGPVPSYLSKNIFDLGFGHLNEYGFFMDMPNYMSDTSSFYVGCRNVRKWIREHCRHGPLVNCHLKQKIKAKYARKIMSNNLDNQNDFNCSLEHNVSRWHKSPVCRRDRNDPSSESGKAIRAHMASTSNTYTSELDRAIKQEGRGKCLNPTVITMPLPSDKVMTSPKESGVCRIN